jgi:ankyrin repeat protein
MAQRKNRVERLLAGLQKKPVVAVAIALGTVVIALSSFTDAAKNLTNLITGLRGRSPEEARAELSNLSVNYSEETFTERVQEGDAAATELFLAAGMNPDLVVDREGNTALMVAAANGRASTVDALIGAGANVNATSRSRATALMSAARQSDAAILRSLISAKANVNDVDTTGDSALSIAAMAGHLANVTLLLDAGTQPDAVNRAFAMAAQARQPEAARLLIERGADVTRVGPEALVRAIRQDAYNNNIGDTVKFMLDVVKDVSGQDSNGWSAVHLAADRGHPTLLRVLLEKGADVNRVCECNGYRGARNWTPVQMAALNSRQNVVEMLLASGADLRHANSRGATPLHSAVDSDTPAIVRALIEKGADVHAKDKDGGTPLDYAAKVPDEKSRAEIVRLLK